MHHQATREDGLITGRPGTWRPRGRAGRHLLTLWVAWPLALLLAACSDATDESAAEAVALTPLEVTEEAILAADGRELLALSALPDEVRVDAEASFSAADRFTEASLAPDEEWLAVATAGVAHGAGWLLPLDGDEPVAVAFQYGGGVSLGPWREDGRYLVFALEGPAPGRTLVLVSRAALGQSVAESARPVRLPEHGAQVPPGTEYRALAWRGEELRFEVEGEPWRLDPVSGEVVAD